MLTREAALRRAQMLSEDHDIVEGRLLKIAIDAKSTGLMEAEVEERETLWRMHDVLERDVIDAYAELHLIDPEACARLREGLAP